MKPLFAACALFAGAVVLAALHGFDAPPGRPGPASGMPTQGIAPTPLPASAPVLNAVGTFVTHKAFHGRGLRDRDLVVWLPPGYATDTGRRYPVLYMLDGRNVFFAATSSFGVPWGVDKAVERLIASGAIGPLIVVAVDNTPDRTDEYMPGPLAETYMDFMVGTLKPFIDSAYRTRPGPADTLIGGSSSGGTLAFMLAWEHPDVFGRAMCMSPAFRIERWDYVRTVRATPVVPRGLRVYLDIGTVDLEARLTPGLDGMLAALRERGWREGVDFAVVREEGARHSEAFWGRRVPHALTLRLGPPSAPASR